MALLLGHNESTLDSTNRRIRPDEITYHTFTAQASGTAEGIRFNTSTVGADVKAALYNAAGDTLLAQSNAITTVDGENDAAFTATYEVASGTDYTIAFHSPNTVHFRINTGGSYPFWTLDNELYSNGFPAVLASDGSGRERAGVAYVYGGSSVSSVTDSVGSTADRITDGENATIQLSEAATATSAELQNNAGTFTASLSVQSSTSNSITVLGNRGQLRFGDTDNKVVLTLDDSSTIEATGITLRAPDGIVYANGSNADTTSDNSLAQGMSSVPANYQGIVNDIDNTELVLNSDLTVASVARPGTVEAALWDQSDGSTGDFAAYELELDTTATLIGKMGKIPLVSLLKRNMRESLRT